MKRIFFVAAVAGLFVLVGAGCNYQVDIKDQSANQPAVNQNQDANQQTTDVTQKQDEKTTVPATDDSKTLTKVSIQDIRNALSKKYPDRDYSNYTITIDNNYQEQFVEGGLTAPEGGGAHYWATKVNGEWMVVKEAQDSVPCSVFEPYNFPKEIVGNDCYVEKTPTPTPDDSKTPTNVSTQDIKNALSKKYPTIDYSNYTITITNNYKEQYVEGGLNAPEGGGAHYWATKVNGEWMVVKEAQDSVPCSVFEPYSFPKEIIGNDCY